jgi:peptide/nickel transport system ATP-binding protein
VGDGECVAIVGESGSGKTTIGRCIAGLHAPDDGEIRFRDRLLAAHAADRPREERQAIQIIFQNPTRSLNPAKTVEQIVGRPLELFQLSRGSAVRQEVRRLLEQVRLPGNVLSRYPRELSGGEKQRVAIARALAARPAVLICDEITSALDVSIQAAIVQLLVELREGGQAIVFITHNLPLVGTVADRVLVLEHGAIKESGVAGDVLHAPRHEYTRALLASAPDLDSDHPPSHTALASSVGYLT